MVSRRTLASGSHTWVFDLGREEEALTATNVKAAYQNCAKALHPDRSGSDSTADLFQKATRAYETLLAIIPKST